MGKMKNAVSVKEFFKTVKQNTADARNIYLLV
jgi:hypothetical protein